MDNLKITKDTLIKKLSIKQKKLKAAEEKIFELNNTISHELSKQNTNNKKKVLLIGSSKVMQLKAKKIFNKDSFEVFFADDVALFLDEHQNIKIDVIIADTENLSDNLKKLI